MKTFEPSAKAIALREYQTRFTALLHDDMNSRPAFPAVHQERSYQVGALHAAAKMCIALGATGEELANIRNIAERIINFEEEKALQG